MSSGELFLRVLSALSPMVPGILAVLAATVAAMLVLQVLCRTTWVQDANFRLAGLFFGMTAKSGLRLGCSWTKMIFVLVFIISFRKLALINYFMILLPGLVLALSESGANKKIAGLLWLVLQTLGLLAANLICGYVLDFSAGLVFVLVYVAMGLFLGFFSVFLFLNELSTISNERDVDVRRVWGEEYEGPTGDEDEF